MSFPLGLLTLFSLIIVINSLHENFTYIDEVDKSILVNLKYFSTENFIGERIPLYKVNRAIMTKQAAEALSVAQKRFQEKGYSILIYDSYRPTNSVLAFVDWMENKPYDMRRKKFHYPYVEKKADMKDIYISSRSGHSRGSVVDMTLVKNGTDYLKHAKYEERIFGGKKYPFNDDNSIDCGTSFDLMDPMSWPNKTVKDGLTEEQVENRKFIIEIMEESGFRVLDEEWWHFILKNEPFNDTYFDFPIE